MMRAFHLTIYQRCSAGWDLVTVEYIWVQWTHCRVQGTRASWKQPSNYCNTVIIKMDMVSNNIWGDYGICSLCIKGPQVWQQNLPHYYISTAAWTTDTRKDVGFMLFTPNSDGNKNVIAERLIRPGDSFPNLLLYNFGFQNVPVLR